MFLTRLGSRSKAVVTGDVTQIDLGDRQNSGLLEAMRVLKGVEDIALVTLSEQDVVRHKLVQAIIQAYDRYNRRQAKEKNTRREYDGKSKSRN